MRRLSEPDNVRQMDAGELQRDAVSVMGLNSVSRVCGVPLLTLLHLRTQLTCMSQQRYSRSSEFNAMVALGLGGGGGGGGGLLRLRRRRNPRIVQISLFNYHKSAEEQNCSCCRNHSKSTAEGQHNKQEHHRSIMGV